MYLYYSLLKIKIMKKIFTLLFAVGMLAVVAQAQPGQRDNRQFDQRNNQQNDQQYGQRNDQRNDQQYGQRNDQQYGQQNNQSDFDKGYDKGKFLVETNNYFDKGGRFDDRFSMERRRDMMISRINQEFDYKIQNVRRNFFMSWFEKQRQIRFLENERQWEISQVYEKCNSYGYRNNDRFHDRDRDNRHY
jgi:hypothetical protein